MAISTKQVFNFASSTRPVRARSSSESDIESEPLRKKCKIRSSSSLPYRYKTLKFTHYKITWDI